MFIRKVPEKYQPKWTERRMAKVKYHRNKVKKDIRSQVIAATIPEPLVDWMDIMCNRFKISYDFLLQAIIFSAACPTSPITFADTIRAVYISTYSGIERDRVGDNINTIIHQDIDASFVYGLTQEEAKQDWISLFKHKKRNMPVGWMHE